MGLSYTGNRCLLVTRVNGNKREPVPPAKMMPFIMISLVERSRLLLSQRSDGYARRTRPSSHARLLATDAFARRTYLSPPHSEQNTWAEPRAEENRRSWPETRSRRFVRPH